MITALISWKKYLTMENKDSNYCHYSGLSSPKSYMEIAEDLPQILAITEVDRNIEIAWEVRTPFDAFEFQFGLNKLQ